MPEIECFAVREKNTQDYLPSFNGSFHTGNPLMRYDGSEDNGRYKNASAMPRLFTTKKKAKGALNAWLKGEWSVSEDTPYLHRPIADRNRKDMEIVSVRVIFPD
jgi:hypothetical protein